MGHTEAPARSRAAAGSLTLALASTVVLAGCGGALSVTPTSPSGTPLPSGSPITITFSGTLADGGSFEGSMIYGTRDLDDRTGYGRYTGGTWDVTVKGGSKTHDVHLSNGTGGRALIETYNKPFPAIGIVLLWPNQDPAVQNLSPHVAPAVGYDPDVQPTLRDFGALIQGQLDPQPFGVFIDGDGGRTLVSSIVIR
jgi:hypothetical protein